MKKLIFVLIVSIVLFSSLQIYAVNMNGEENIVTETEEVTRTELQRLEELYENEVFGKIAYVLNQIRIYSLPVGFVGIVISAETKAAVHRPCCPPHEQTLLFHPA